MHKLTNGLFASLLLCVLTVPVLGQILPKDWQKAVVLIEVAVTVDGQMQFAGAGTGFLIGKRIDEKTSRVYLATARHVVTGLLQSGKVLTIRLDNASGGFSRVALILATSTNEKGSFLIGTSRAEIVRISVESSGSGFHTLGSSGHLGNSFL